MFVRIARFESDPSGIDERIAAIRSRMEEGSAPPGLEGARKSMMLVDRQTGVSLGLTFFDTEDALREGDRAMNEMTPPAGIVAGRTSVEMYEVAIEREWS